ncbi:MAG: aspartate/glutamate racemase family protein [Lawsonibacter sp.]|nr:aspartate/glutamate racemase family protein [Lawsonibacter sp.]
MKLIGGHTNYGQDIGILMLDTTFPRIPGDIGNAKSYPGVPVRYKVVKNAFTSRIMGQDHDPALLEPFIQAARELEDEGCKAITTSCGFLAKFQRTLADSVHIPVFTSAIMLVPLVRQMINRDREIAIFTERPWNLTEDHFNQAGFSSRDIPVVVSGMPEGSPFPALFIDGGLEEEREVLQQCMEEMTARHMREHPNTGAIVFECTNFGPFSRQVQDIARVPVFGINQLLEYIAACVDVRSYY